MMDRNTLRAALHAHQQAALDVLERGSLCIDAGVDAVVAALDPLRAELAQVLNAYQTFKHDGIFDPAVASGDPDRMALGRAMKVECIAAGETFRTHLRRWKEPEIRADWPNYRVSVRLTMGQLRRHIDHERAGILELIERTDVRDLAA